MSVLCLCLYSLILGRKLKTQIAMNLQPTGNSLGCFHPFKLCIYKGQVGVFRTALLTDFCPLPVLKMCFSVQRTVYIIPLLELMKKSLFSPAFQLKPVFFFPAVCHIPQSSQLCVLFLDEHSGNFTEQCARVAC